MNSTQANNSITVGEFCDRLKGSYNELSGGFTTGLKKGAQLSLAAVTTTVFFDIQELNSRMVGNQPSYPLTQRDCELAQFKDSYQCTVYHGYDYGIRILVVAGGVIGTTLLSGAIGSLCALPSAYRNLTR